METKSLKALAQNNISSTIQLSSGWGHTVGLKSDGTVVVTGYNSHGQCNIGGWSEIASISAGYLHTVGIKRDRTVLAAGYNGHGQCNVSKWEDIVAISTGEFHTVGLKSNGTVVATGHNNYNQCNVVGWNNIVAISAGAYHTIGLKNDGTIISVGQNEHGQCNVSEWRNIVDVSAGYYYTVALKSDGTILKCGVDYVENYSGWNNIVEIIAGGYHTVGLRRDGTVVATGRNYENQNDTGRWSNIIAISAGGFHTVALKSDGTIVTAGSNDYGQCNIRGSAWNLDVTAPEISLNGDSVIDVEYNSEYVDAGITVIDNFCMVEDIEITVTVNGQLVDGIDDINITELGEYTIIYKATDVSGNSSSVTRLVRILDVNIPVITLNGDRIVTVEVGTFYIDPGVMVTNNKNEEIEAIIGGSVDITKIGEYILTYNATDRLGNKAREVRRLVKVVDTTAPQIIINGENPMKLVVGGAYSENRVTVIDNSGETITLQATITYNSGGNVTTVDSIDTNKIGVYTINYTATDSSGNSSSKTETIQVIYYYSGVLKPINKDRFSGFKAGSTIPVKFQLKDATGNTVSTAIAKLSYAKVTNNVVGDINEAISASATENLFRYYATSGQYIYNFNTKGFAIGNYKLIITLDDGSSYSALIGLR